MKLGGYKVVVDIPAMSPELFEVITGYQPKTIPALVADIGVAVSTHNMTASIMPGGSGVALDLGGPAAVLAACTGWVHQDDDAHETCSLTACLNPLHPGPCKGWKGNLFKVAPNAYHALESARVEKANATRLKKIQALKDAGKPIPKKLLQPIVAKPHPHAGKTANAATGEAHTAGQAVTDAAGVHVQMPGKVTLGQAVKQIKATDATTEKGAKGKKPTVASKGIAAVIAQEKVTPQYKLDKASKITPEQWNALSDGEKSIIRGELEKIQKEGFGPQQKKATELLDALPAKGLKGGGTDTVTTPKGQVIQKVEPAPGPLNEKVAKVKDEIAKGATLSEAVHKVTGKTPVAPEEPKPGPGSLQQANAIKNITEAIHGPQTVTTVHDVTKKVDVMKKSTGKIEDHPAFGTIAGKLASAAQKKAYAQKQSDIPGVDVYYSQIAEHIKEGKTGLPKAVQDVVDNHKPGAISTDASMLAKTKNDVVKAVKAEKEAKAAEPLPLPKSKIGGLPNTASPLGTQTLLKTHGSLDLTFAKGTDYEKHFNDVGLPGNGGHEHYLVNEGKGNWYVTDKDGKKLQFLSKSGGVHLSPATKKPDATKIENAAESAPKPLGLPKHVQEAVAMANGTAPGASWSKNHLAAYQKLSAEEFNALPADVQDKIVQELKKGATKFLDPKKVAATHELLAKFDTGKPAPKVPAAKVGFHTHMTDHSVSEAQAKNAAAWQPVAAHAAVAKELAGLDLADQPDVMAHHNDAKQYASDLVATFVKHEPADALKDPAVQQEMENVAAAAYALKQAQLVGKAKQNAYNKIDMLLKGDQGKLSPIQKASLAEYQKYLLGHPSKTEPEQIVQLQQDVLAATDALTAKLKDAKAPKAADMTPAQLDSKVAELLGPEAVKPQVNLNLAEVKEANATGKNMAHLGTEKYSQATLEDPNVAAKMKDVELAAAQLAATAENKQKLQAHLSKYHYKALNDHDAGMGTLNAPQLAAIKAHAAKLKDEHAYIDDVISQQQDKLMEARKAFDEVANKVQNTPHAPVTLSDYDVATISEAYGNNWGKQASKAVTYGLKDYSKKLEMKAHPEYTPFTQDLGNLQQAVKNLALAHAHEHTAGLNVPTDPNSGAKLAGPEKNAWLTAVQDRMKAESEYQKLYKVAQTRLDKIRTDIGLTKRALPKIDSPAVKAAAAESAYYKTAGYNGPNYGKHTAAKSYTLAKVGPKLGIKHQSASEKKAEKAAAEAEKLKAAHPDFYAKKEADKAASKPKDGGAPTNAEAGKTPNPMAALTYKWKYLKQTGPALGQWDYSTKSAYIADEAHLKAATDILNSPDVQHGLAAQKQFKWSINNMESKGASHAAKGSLYSYTGSGYDTVNTKLNSLPPGIEKTGSATITNIDNGMAASPELESDTVLYRGFKSPYTVFSSGKWNDTNVAGMEWSQRSYSSTSGALTTAQSFAGSGGVVMRIIIPKEMKVHGINAKGGQHPGENEIILQRGLRYRVVADYGKHGNDGKRYIDVMVVPSPYAKPE